MSAIWHDSPCAAERGESRGVLLGGVLIGAMLLSSVSCASDPQQPSAIVLRDSLGETLEVEVAGPDRIAGAAEIAREIRVVDHALAQAEGLEQDRAAAARSFLDAAQFELSRGMQEAASVRGFAGAQLDRQTSESANAAVAAAEGVLAATSSINDVVATRVRGPAATILRYVSLQEYRTRSEAQRDWTSYNEGERLRVRAYMFRMARPGGASCEEIVHVWDDPTERVLSCP